ncbi:MAG: MBL fold metallo-hydrolase, partial [Anaerolineae bacterium]|nr:MBL fold metallo-hydrolase [Anaerolineae bacterium]
MNAKELVGKLTWLGHDSFRLDGPVVIYFDPWKLSGRPPVADLVLVSHEHHDHCSPEDVALISGPETVVV